MAEPINPVDPAITTRIGAQGESTRGGTLAMEYKNQPIVPIIAYSAASLIGVSRITENRHWISDVFAGAALGYFTGRLVVNNYHRYAKLKAPKQKNNSVSLNLQYNFGRLMPGLVYRF